MTMAFLIKCLKTNALLVSERIYSDTCLKILCHYSQMPNLDTKEEFRVLDLVRKIARRTTKRNIKKVQMMPPRTTVMPVDQDWSSVWPGPRSFNPASVPLPVRQGYNPKGASPGKFVNAELMKIPNFLHLTPPAVKKQCAALKQFCTPWPEELKTEKTYEKHFPLEVITTDYCHSSPDIRDPLARIVTIKVNLNNLTLDAHAKDKFLRLVGDHYNPKTNVLTIAADRCPLRQQNYEYAIYLLTALYHEAWKTEPWESEKTLADMEYYEWEKNVSRQSIETLLSWLQDEALDISNVSVVPHLQQYKEAVSAIMNSGEDDYTINQYKEVTKKLFSLPEDDSTLAT